jgi:hypothetical protein
LLLPIGQDRHSPGHETEISRTAASPKFAFREAGTQVSPVTMSHPSLRTSAPPCLPLFIKELLKEDRGFFWGFGFWLLLWDMELLPFALDFLLWEAFGREENY